MSSFHSIPQTLSRLDLHASSNASASCLPLMLSFISGLAASEKPALRAASLKSGADAIRYLAAGGLGAPGALGAAPGALGAPGAGAGPEPLFAEPSSVPHFLHLVASGGLKPPQLGHVFIISSNEGGLKHMSNPFYVLREPRPRRGSAGDQAITLGCASPPISSMNKPVLVLQVIERRLPAIRF